MKVSVNLQTPVGTGIGKFSRESWAKILPFEEKNELRHLPLGKKMSLESKYP
jgi:hypothetical protein